MACEKIPFEGGFAIICGGRRSRVFCKFCGGSGQFLCDAPVIRQGRQQTCDIKLCAHHRKNVAPGVDLCPAHGRQYELNGNQFTIGDVALDPKKEPAEEKPAALPTDSNAVYQVFKPGSGWLSQRDARGSRSWVADRSKAQSFPGGTTLDVTLRAHRLQAFIVIPSLFPMEVHGGQ